MFLKFDGPWANNRFISVVILSFTRPDHLKNLLVSIHRNADMPFEVIVHDDNSPEEIKDRIFNEVRSLTSTLAFSQMNMGFSASANRAVGLASSDYILFLNDDTLVTGPCFQTIKSILDAPYVGTVGPWQTVQGVSPGSPHGTKTAMPVSSNGVDFYLMSLGLGAGVFAFRKAVWSEIGGFPQVYNNGGDIAFMHKMCQHGYFHAARLINKPETFTNVDQDDGYINPTAERTKFDSAYPMIFKANDFEKHCELRRVRVHEFSQEEYLKDFGLNNISSWSEYFCNAVSKEDGFTYDWELLKQHGQDKWRAEVERDIATWRAKGG